MSRKRRPGGKPRILEADPSSEGLAKKMLGHFIPYEIGMMRALYSKLLHRSPTQLDRNADIESFHIHARNLIEFFTDDKQCAIDPRAFTKKEHKLDKNFMPKSLENKISQQIVHLTHDRTDVDADKLSDDQRKQTSDKIEEEIEQFDKALCPKWRPIWEEGLKRMDFQANVDAKEPIFKYEAGPKGNTGSIAQTIQVGANNVLGPTNEVTPVSSGPFDPASKT